MATPHAGSWTFMGKRLPDYGVTEKIGDALGFSRTDQGGSQLFGVTNTDRSVAQGGSSQAVGGVSDTRNSSQAIASPLPSTQTTYVPSNSPSGGGGGDAGADLFRDGRHFSSEEDYQIWKEQGGAEGQRIRDEINQGYDAWFSDVDRQINELPGARTSQEQLLQQQYGAGLDEINTQRDLAQQGIQSNLREINESQTGTLADLDEQLRNSMRAGQVFLGARGAGDSSASNQMAYALTKLGNQNRGDVLSQSRELTGDVREREQRVNTILDSEINKLNRDKQSKMIEISQWYQDAVSQLKSMKAQGQLQRGQSLASLSRDLLNTAINAAQQYQQQVAERQNALLGWAASRSANLGELRQNVAGINQMQVPGRFGMNFNPQIQLGGGAADLARYYGAGSSEDDERISSLADLAV